MAVHESSLHVPGCIHDPFIRTNHRRSSRRPDPCDSGLFPWRTAQCTPAVSRPCGGGPAAIAGPGSGAAGFCSTGSDLARPAANWHSSADAPPRSIAAADPAETGSPGALQPAMRPRPQVLPPILPQGATPSTVQPHAGDAFALPANFALKPRGSGQPLPEPMQKKMESFFNTSFADVRVHVGHELPSIGALAFTHGTDLYFAPGQYNPQSSQGQRLLGHELTHVVQQRAGRVRNPLGAGVAVVQDPVLEAEAEQMGLRARRRLCRSRPSWRCRAERRTVAGRRTPA